MCRRQKEFCLFSIKRIDSFVSITDIQNRHAALHAGNEVFRKSDTGRFGKNEKQKFWNSVSSFIESGFERVSEQIRFGPANRE